MSLETTLTKLIRLIAKRELLMQITEGTVTAVDKTANTCTVERDDLPELQNVRLNAILEAGTKTITVYPSVGSSVLCAMIENNSTDAYVIDCNEIESIVINGGSKGGLININDLVSKVNAIEDKVNEIIDGLNAVIIPLAPSGSYALSADFGTVTTLTNTDAADIEDDKIKH